MVKKIISKGIGVSWTFARNRSWGWWHSHWPHDIGTDNSRTAYQISMKPCLDGQKGVWMEVVSCFCSSDGHLDHGQSRCRVFCVRSPAPVPCHQVLRQVSTKHIVAVSLQYVFSLVWALNCIQQRGDRAVHRDSHLWKKLKITDINVSFSRQGGHWRLIRVVDWY